MICISCFPYSNYLVNPVTENSYDFSSDSDSGSDGGQLYSDSDDDSIGNPFSLYPDFFCELFMDNDVFECWENEDRETADSIVYNVVCNSCCKQWLVYVCK